MAYKTRYGSHYHITRGCCGAEEPCTSTEGLAPCSICCGNDSTGGSGIGGGAGGGTGSIGGLDAEAYRIEGTQLYDVTSMISDSEALKATEEESEEDHEKKRAEERELEMEDAADELGRQLAGGSQYISVEVTLDDGTRIYSSGFGPEYAVTPDGKTTRLPFGSIIVSENGKDHLRAFGSDEEREAFWAGKEIRDPRGPFGRLRSRAFHKGALRSALRSMRNRIYNGIASVPGLGQIARVAHAVLGDPEIRRTALDRAVGLARLGQRMGFKHPRLTLPVINAARRHTVGRRVGTMNLLRHDSQMLEQKMRERQRLANKTHGLYPPEMSAKVFNAMHAMELEDRNAGRERDIKKEMEKTGKTREQIVREYVDKTMADAKRKYHLDGIADEDLSFEQRMALSHEVSQQIETDGYADKVGMLLSPDAEVDFDNDLETSALLAASKYSDVCKRDLQEMRDGTFFRKNLAGTPYGNFPSNDHWWSTIRSRASRADTTPRDSFRRQMRQRRAASGIGVPQPQGA